MFVINKLIYKYMCWFVEFAKNTLKLSHSANLDNPKINIDSIQQQKDASMSFSRFYPFGLLDVLNINKGFFDNFLVLFLVADG
jgi:hypothetical protein